MLYRLLKIQDTPAPHIDFKFTGGENCPLTITTHYSTINTTLVEYFLTIQLHYPYSHYHYFLRSLHALVAVAGSW